MKQILAFVAALFLSISMAFAAVNVNTATQDELQTLDGIGPVRAKAIIDYRTKNGPFKSIDDLQKVPGIGESTLSSIKKDLTLTGKTTVSAGDKKGSDKKASSKADAKSEGKAGKDDKTSAKGSAADKTTDTKESKAKSDDKKSDRATDKSKSDDAKSKSTKKDEKKAEASK